MTGVAICEVERTRTFTQRAASGHTAMPPASVMNSRRFIGVPQPDRDATLGRGVQAKPRASAAGDLRRGIAGGSATAGERGCSDLFAEKIFARLFCSAHRMSTNCLILLTKRTPFPP